MNNKIIDIDRLSRYHENINTVLATKQESLVSGDNIKTINGESILGSGNIESLASKEYVDSIKDDNIYITDFTIFDLKDIFYSEDETSKAADIASLVAAAQANKIIIVPISPEIKFGCVANIDIYDENVELWLYYYNTRIEIRLLTTSQEITFDNVWMEDNQSVLISGENIRTINGEDIIGDGSNLELATKDELNAKADDSSVVHKEGDEVIDGVKTFRGPVKFLDIGDYAITIGPDTRVGVDGANTNVLGLIRGAFFAGSPSYPLFLHGSTERPKYNVNNVELALLSDVDAKQDALISGTNIKTINGESILGSGDITISGGSSNANIQAVDTGDVIDDVNVDYATKAYVDGLVGDINSVLESIINGNEINEVVVNIVETYLAAPVPKENIYDVICVLSKPLDVKQTATLYYLDGENQPQTLSLVVEYGQTEFVFEQVMINHIEPDMYSVVIGEIEEEDANGIKVTLRSNFKFKYVYS